MAATLTSTWSKRLENITSAANKNLMSWETRGGKFPHSKIRLGRYKKQKNIRIPHK